MTLADNLPAFSLEYHLAPYLDMGERPTGAPIFTHAPCLAWDAYTRKTEPWFASPYLQRSMIATFRSELSKAADLAGLPHAAAQADFEAWIEIPGSAAKRRLADNVVDLPEDPLELALLARTISYLGFHGKARNLLKAVPDRTGPGYSYARYTGIFIDHIIHLGRRDYQREFEGLYFELGSDVTYARTRLSLCILAIVASAQLKQLPELAKWHGRGSEALERYVALPQVDDFEKALTTSRFYRAAAFEPFLNGRHDDLRADLDRWLGIARELVGHDERTRILATENMYPAVESASRTEAALGNKTRSRDLMEEMVTKIDPIDSKAWLQVGELRRRDGDERGALQAYLTSAQFQVPLGRIAWFNAGRCWERLGEAQEAVQCYKKSLELWPTGLAPAQRIAAIEAS
ncbi:tetratricopeptide repeat protein [Streptomyces sp. NPDC051132]|uniref:tetratricopeptide repeat protein n=1 Tax=unclassified Streptomyces TaxID=2593676 RepID=UPI0034200C4C